MASDADIAIRVRADGNSVKRAIAGITKDLTAAEKDRAKEAKKADAEVTKSAEKAAKERTKLQERHVSSFKRGEQSKRSEAIARAREILDDFRKAERKKREELAKTLRETQMSERQRANIIARTERQIASDRGRATRQASGARTGTTGRAGMIAGGLAAGGVALAGAGFNAVGRMAAAGGVRSREQLLQETLTYNRDLAALSAQSGISANDLRSKIDAAAVNTGRDQAELLASLQMNQGRFGNVDAAVANLENLGRAAVGANASVESLSLAVGTAGTVYQLTAEQSDEFLNQMIAVGAAGSIEAEQMAETFAPFFGVYQRSSGATGAAGAEGALRFAGLMGTSYAGDSQSLTLAESALRQMGSMDVQERLALATGGRAVGRGRNRRIEGGQRLSADGSIGGQVTDPLEAIRQLQALNLSPGQLQRILGDSQAVQGVGVIGTAMNSEQGQAIMNASAADGRALVQSGLNAQESVNGAGRDLDRARAESFRDFAASGDAYTRAVVRSTEEMGRLNANYPGAIEGLETLKDAAMGLAGILAAAKLAALGGAGAGVAGATGLGTALASAGTTVAGAGTVGAGVATAGTAAAGLGIGLGIGRVLAHGVDAVTGNNQASESSNEFFSSLFSTDRSVLADVWAGIGSLREGVAGDANHPSSRPSERATEASNRAAQDLAAALRENTAATRENSRAPDTGGDTGLN